MSQQHLRYFKLEISIYFKLKCLKFMLNQNRRQEVFNRWALRFCGGLDIVKLTKTPLIYSVSCFNAGGWSFVWGAIGLSPSKPPCDDETVLNTCHTCIKCC